MNNTQIYVRLLDEFVDVWRPVQAECLSMGLYQIAYQPYDRETESWEFQPGEMVVCEHIESSDGQILAATKRVETLRNGRSI